MEGLQVSLAYLFRKRRARRLKEADRVERERIIKMEEEKRLEAREQRRIRKR